MATTLDGDTPAVLTVDEVAAILRVSRKTVYNLFSSGELGWIPVGSRRRVSRDAVQAYLNRNSTGAPRAS